MQNVPENVRKAFAEKESYLKSFIYDLKANADGIYQNQDGNWQCHYSGRMCAQISMFSDGRCFETHGGICQKWYEVNKEGQFGLPVSDEESAGAGYKISRFEHGAIRWSEVENACEVLPNAKRKLKVAMRKECVVCHKKYLRIVNWNCVDDYNYAVGRLKLSPIVPKDRFVCKHCAEKATATKVKKECAVCHKECMVGLSDNFIDLHNDRDLLIEFLKASGLVQDAECVSKSLRWVCEDCYRGLAEKAIKQHGDCSARDLFLYAPIVHKQGHCSRCGQQIQHDFSPIALRFYEDQKNFSDQQDFSPIALGFCKMRCVPSTAATFLRGQICHKCVPFLLPEKVNQYVWYMLNDGGWKGEMSTALYQSTFPFEITFEELEDEGVDCRDINLLEKALRDKAISLGANALLNFHYARCEDSGYVGGATPIRLDPIQANRSSIQNTRQPKEDAVVVPKGTVVCIDGSNVIRKDLEKRTKTLWAMIEALEKNGYHAKTFVDRSIFPWLRNDMHDEEGAESLNRGVEKTLVIVAPSKAEADGQILQFAEYERSAHIISNDRYRDYVKLHPWLDDGKNRVHGFNLVRMGNGSVRVLIAGFNLDITVS